MSEYRLNISDFAPMGAG